MQTGALSGKIFSIHEKNSGNAQGVIQPTENTMKIDDEANYSKRGEELFSLYRDYLKHEDNLINQRTTWLITIQSFLIATFGFSYQNRFTGLITIYSGYLEKNGYPTLSSSSIGTIPPEILENITRQYPEIGIKISNYNNLLYALSIIGLITSVIAFFSVSAAVNATVAIRKKWYAISSFSRRIIANQLPDISGGGSRHAHLFGKVMSLSLPIFFIVFWSVIVFMICKKYL